MARAFMLNSSDNVATLIDPAARGEKVSLVGQSSGQMVTADEIAFGHKLATRDIKRGDQVIKYGKVIGQATKDIAAGSHVHVHNVEALRARGDKKESS
jgi:altronate dehydratase small subunit